MWMYQSTYVRYERRGDRVVPVRVTKQWVTKDMPQGTKPIKTFKVVRVSELRRMPLPEETAPEAWVSSTRVETRERLQTLLQKGDPEGEPVVREAGYDQCWLPLGPPNLSAAAAAWTLDNGNGCITVLSYPRFGGHAAISKGPRLATREWNEPPSAVCPDVYGTPS